MYKNSCYSDVYCGLLFVMSICGRLCAFVCGCVCVCLDETPLSSARIPEERNWPRLPFDPLLLWQLNPETGQFGEIHRCGWEATLYLLLMMYYCLFPMYHLASLRLVNRLWNISGR